MNNEHKWNKFKTYWGEIGKPQLEYKNRDSLEWIKLKKPGFFNECKYRIAGDRHWELRLKWINSDKTLPIELKNKPSGRWVTTSIPEWNKNVDYREGKIKMDKSPLNNQIGGDHYCKMKIQPIEFIHANGIGFIEGSVIKYVSRWRDKGGIQDLEKAKHFIDLLIELEKDNG